MGADDRTKFLINQVLEEARVNLLRDRVDSLEGQISSLRADLEETNRNMMEYKRELAQLKSVRQPAPAKQASPVRKTGNA